ncbi:MAG TPA: carbonic anhydrase [Alphaproteobacteria bacterium]|nr:carbonic anhydrase [Alphaproteobacteria bacterium]
MHRFPASLLSGYRSFMEDRYAREKDRYRQLAESGQAPRAMIIACCDSRSAPETIFNAGPGELFVVRNVANLVPPFEQGGGQHGTSAAIEFAVNSIEVSDIVVMGHGRCGGIHAALGHGPPLAPGDFIGKWMSLLQPVTDEVARYAILTDNERRTMLERLSIRNSIQNLRTFPYVREREAEGRLALHGAWFDISTGELWVMDPDTGDFSRPEF